MYMYFDHWMVYVGYALVKLVNVISIIANVSTSDLLAQVCSGSAFHHCYNLKERFAINKTACASNV